MATSQRVKELNIQVNELVNNLLLATKAEKDFMAGLASSPANQSLRETLALLQQIKKEIISDIAAKAGTTASKTRASTATTVHHPAGMAPPVGSEKTIEETLKLAQALNQGGNAADKAAAKINKYGYELKELESIQHRIATDPKFAALRKQLERYGYGPENITRAYSKGTDITQYRAEDRSQGVIRQTDFMVDKFGKTMPTLSNQYRSFFQGVTRDIGELAKWSIALAVIYGPLNKLSELMVLMVENETKLADATIAVNSSFMDQGSIFDVAADAANKAGEGVSGVIDAFTQAYKAAGRYSNDIERAAQATALLDSALTLSKLSTLDQAGAIDNLTAALLQSGMELDQGAELLNKWVRVSQVAYVGIDALAIGVATLGDTAEAAGLSIDELNALIAVIAEKSNASSQEIANIAKALVGAFGKPEVATALNQVGISVVDVTGKARQFEEVMEELSQMRITGALGDEAFSAITMALGGGGVRRQSNVAAVIEGWNNYKRIVGESAEVTDDSTLAQDSLEKKLETVQTATTRLANAFQSLAQSLGDEGGLLDNFAGLIDILTGFVTVLDKITAALGKAGPALYAFGIASLLLRNKPTGYVTESLAGGLSSIPFMAGGGRMAGPGLGTDGGMMFAPGMTQRGSRAQSTAKFMTSGAMSSAAMMAIPAIANLSQGKTKEAGADIAGGIIGALVTGGNPAGAIIGAAIAEAFVSATVIRAEDFTKLFAGIIEDQPKAKPGEPLSEEEQLREVYKQIGGGSVLKGQITSVVEQFVSAFSPKIKEKLGDLPEGGKYATKESAALGILERQNPQLFAELTARGIQEGAIPEGKLSPQKLRQQELLTTDAAILRELQQARSQELLKQVTGGEIKSTDYAKQLESISSFSTRGTGFMAAFGEEFKKLAPDIDSTAEAYQAFLDVMTYGNEEQLNSVNAIIAEINKLETIIDNWVPGTKSVEIEISGVTKDLGIDEINEQINNLKEQAAQTMAAAYTETRLQRANLPQIVGDINEPYTSKETQGMVEEARKLQEQYLSQFLSPDLMAQYEAKLEEFTVLVADAGQEHYETIKGIDQKFWSAAQKLFEEEKAAKTGIGFQQFDVSRAQLESAAKKSMQIGSEWKQKWGYDYKPTTEIAIDAKGLAQPLKADFKIMQMLLQELVDQGQKQLDGQYNIPEGATFWVPLTAAYYKPEGGGGLKGGGGLTTGEGTVENTLATKENTEALNRFNERISRIMEHEERSGALKKAGIETEREKGERIYKESETDDYRKKVGWERYRASETGRDSIYSEEYYSADKFGKPTISTEDVLNTLLVSLRTAIDTSMWGPIIEAGIIAGMAIAATDLGTKIGESIINAFGQFKDFFGISAESGFNGVPKGTEANVSAKATRLDLNIDSRTQLIVDGRVLATVIKPFLASDLMRTEQTQGTITRRFVL